MIDLNALPSSVADDVSSSLQGVEPFMFSILDRFHSSLCALMSRSEQRPRFTIDTCTCTLVARENKDQLPASLRSTSG